jgi:hypothetical protein
MSDDVLERLKTVPAPPMSIDPFAAMAAGRRARVRQRRIAMVAAAVATLVVTAGSLLVAGRHGALPTHPTPARPTPSTAPRSLTAPLEVPGHGQLTASLDPAAATITLRGPGSRAGQPNSPAFAVPVPTAPGKAACRVSPALRVQACAVRAPVREAIVAYGDPTTPDVPLGQPVVGHFSVPDVSVVAIGAASVTDLPSLRGAAWVLDDGTVADSTGAAIPQTHARTVPVAVFAARHDGTLVIGLWPDSMDGWVASGPDTSGVAQTGIGDLTGDYYAYGLPAAAATGRVRPPDGANVAEQEVLVLGHRKILVAHLTGVKHFTHPTVDWVDQHRGEHTLKLP